MCVGLKGQNCDHYCVTAVGRVALANLPHKDLLGKGNGRGRENDPSSSEEGGGQSTIARPHTREMNVP